MPIATIPHVFNSSANCLRLILAFLCLGFANAAYADPVGFPVGFEAHTHNGRNPAVMGDTVEFTLPAVTCSGIEYQGREVADCDHGNQRTMLKSTQLVRPGEAARYSFSIYIDPSLRFRGGPNRRSLLTVADWRRDEASQNKLYAMHLDAVKGLTFGDEVCVSPDRFRAWNTVTVIIHFHEQDGVLQVQCNNRTIVSKVGVNTVIPADCAADFTFQCDPSLQEPDHPVEMRIGLLHQGYGPFDQRRGLSPEGRMLRSSAMIRVRDIHVAKVDIVRR